MSQVVLLPVDRFVYTDLRACFLEVGTVGLCPRRRHVLDIQRAAAGYVSFWSDPSSSPLEFTGWRGPGANFQGVDDIMFTLHFDLHDLWFFKDPWLAQFDIHRYWGHEDGEDGAPTCEITYITTFWVERRSTGDGNTDDGYNFPNEFYRQRFDDHYAGMGYSSGAASSTDRPN